MRFSILAIVLLSASASVSANAANEDQRSHQLLRRRRVLNEQQVTLKVNLAPNCQVESTQLCSNLSSCLSQTDETEGFPLPSHPKHGTPSRL
jgi:hypothetical protein